MKRKKRGKKNVLKELSIGRILPNLATLLALFVGLTQIKFALNANWEYAILAVVAAAILDVSDGRLARMLNACSRFGAELDSLSDLVVFGVCPAVVVYLFALSKIDRIGWVVSAFFAICIALRLARFNVQDIENVTTELSKRGYSVGVPAPAGAILCLFPVILYNAFEMEIFKTPYICLTFSVIASLLCVSKIPTFTIKKVHIKKNSYKVFLLCIMISMSITFIYTWKAFSLAIVAYMISILISNNKAKKILDKEYNNATFDT
ncbi:MAG: phosphatidylcholine/phosphatidylserine synthase [Holosporales bacterium]|jgi:CDP-diacylglycerol--serine O-phosphatidyltransferase|nr:phosphatidylcholine/phosphatidylserine synthase [Holosporales bacterium]